MAKTSTDNAAPSRSLKRWLAPAGIIVLLAFLLTMNSIAIVVRDRYERAKG